MVRSDRRRTKRLIKRAPLGVVPGGASQRNEERAECLNISFTGVYFATDLKLKAGSTIQLRLRMPEEIFPGQPKDWKFVARVVHVEPLGSRCGVGAQLLYYSVD